MATCETKTFCFKKMEHMPFRAGLFAHELQKHMQPKQYTVYTLPLQILPDPLSLGPRNVLTGDMFFCNKSG